MPDRAMCHEVARFFSERLNMEVSSFDEDLFETGALDSLTFVDLVLYLEQEYGLHIGSDELEPEYFRSIGKIAAFAAAHSSLKKIGAA
ncbi:MAG TPA: acyl carrier protein [Bryobacteraceae bacterium]|nr:acyl carrier protein [Bryobacteraceae bacterium]